jgi:hypothetical protein
MADAVIFIGWGSPVRGREQKSLTVFGESIAYWNTLQQEGAIEAVETVLLDPHGGDLAGFALLKGERAKLDEVRQRDEFQKLVVRAGLIVDNLGVVNGGTGGGLGQQLAVFGEQIAELT